jgi:hypothetical protein
VPLSHFSTYFFSDDDTHRMFRPHEGPMTPSTGATAPTRRACAGELNDPEAKGQMLAVARGYDRLAERAGKRLRSMASPLEPSP